MMADLRAEAKAAEECGCSMELFALQKPKWVGCYLRFVLVRAKGRDWYDKRFETSSHLPSLDTSKPPIQAQVDEESRDLMMIENWR